ncbi:carboxypeptidase-like regulatory domain-containing protein [Aurantibacter crassamenti]|uniref:TonB-dependent receptor n=1 Tax=Aurantibacter crassamenti TaxID=1837375 RepID=UPI001939B749|nr:TonB-dependent receptor [Aurantibacter crassamenti]MBM1104900.1 carboxypeptidase-like regulatory domain-containing protein [Aurantibacter crassamenti]
MKKMYFAMVAFLFTAVVFSQGTITGTVIDGESSTPLPGASVVVAGTSNGTSTDFDGNFSIEVSENSGNLIVSYIGFVSKNIAFTGPGALAQITLEPDAEELEGVVVVGTGVIDLAKERETPVAVSTITASEIVAKVGNQEFPEVLNKTPSVYATKQGGGYGDSRISVRGFSQSNTAFIINGQPVNDMENGWVYWSNWQGLSDIASGMQVQRGLGASKLAVPSVGGTVTIVTKSTDKEAGGFATGSVGNDGYFKQVFGINSGKNEKGWATSVLLGHWSGDGYVDGTSGEGFTYLFSLGYEPSDKHAFNFTFTGAGQWHNQRDLDLSIRDYQNFGGDDFRRFNADHGTLNGDEYSFRKNFYNKPIATLNWDWDLGSNWSLSSSFYGSWGRGGGTGSRGRNFGIYPFQKDLTAAIEEGDLPYRTAAGTIDFDAIVANNRAGVGYSNEDSDYNGLRLGSNGYNDNGVNSNVAIRRASMNSHNWYGAISNLKYENNNWTYGIGVDLRAYKGYHYRVLNDLLGLDGYFSTGNSNLSEGVILTETIAATPFNDTGLNGDKIDYYNIGDVRWSGVNGIIEYKSNNKLSAVLQAGISNQGYKRIDPFDQVNNVVSERENILGGYVKGGANYNLDDANNVFFNTGYIARQPNFDAVFPNFANIINDDVNIEKITSFELGYGYRTNILSATLNLYSTAWKDRFISRGVELGGGAEGTANFEGVSQLHQGVEIELIYRPVNSLKFNGMLSVGNWRYKDDIASTVFDDNNNQIGTSTLFVDDVKVGDAAQFTAYIAAAYTIVDDFNVDLSWRNASNLYADLDIENDDIFLTDNNQGALKLPSYNLFDLGIDYRFRFAKSNLFARVNVNNVFDTEYISESDSNIHATSGSQLYNGIDTNNYVWFGFGRTWNLSLRYNF